jgi:hypothetical protein
VTRFRIIEAIMTPPCIYQCDEATPCDGCARRGELCSNKRVSQARQSVTPRLGIAPDAVVLDIPDGLVDLLQMKLFHHFTSSTRRTLLLPFDAWDVILQLALEHEFLMSAMLCLAARHLSTLKPDNPAYAQAAATHLSRALSLFRRDMPDPEDSSLTASTIDAFLATSLLLQFCLWTSTDFCYTADYGNEAEQPQQQLFDGSRDWLWILASSFKQVLLQLSMLAFATPPHGDPSMAPAGSVVLPYLVHYPLFALVEAARISQDTFAAYQDFFSHNRPIKISSLDNPPCFTRGTGDTDLAPVTAWTLHGPDNPAAPDPIIDGYAPVISRLCLIMSFLPDSGQWASPAASTPTSSTASSSPFTTITEPISVDSAIFIELASYIVTMPILCHGPFAGLVQQEDPHALLLLYHFYRATARLLPETACWWAHHRATGSEEALRARLLGLCDDAQ